VVVGVVSNSEGGINVLSLEFVVGIVKIFILPAAIRFRKFGMLKKLMHFLIFNQEI
jgi:hypothetical protein